MTRTDRYVREYGKAVAAQVLSSIAACGGAGRTGDRVKIEAARQRHYALMASLGR